MKKTLFGVVSIVLIALFSFPLPCSAGQNFQQVYDNLDLKKNTKLHVKEYWKGVEGSEVSWTGKVFDVRAGRGKAELLIANQSRKLHRGYNIAVVVYDQARAGKLKKGQQVKFKGYLHDYSAGRHGGVVITLKDGEIL